MDSSTSMDDSSNLSNNSNKIPSISNASQSLIAQKTWEISNSIQGFPIFLLYFVIDCSINNYFTKTEINSVEELYKFDEIAHRNLLSK